MGRDSHFCCIDCKKDYDLGYGSCMTWLDEYGTLAEYDAAESEYKYLAKNMNIRHCMEEHEQHEFTFWSNDWCGVDAKGDLVGDWGYTNPPIFARNFTEFERVILSDE